MSSQPSWSGVRRGPLQPGEWIRLTDTKGRRHNIQPRAMHVLVALARGKARAAELPARMGEE